MATCVLYVERTINIQIGNAATCFIMPNCGNAMTNNMKARNNEVHVTLRILSTFYNSISDIND
jgi:predicted RNA-binding Zn-ribbon protein involved in translation (DUF1610 family)